MFSFHIANCIKYMMIWFSKLWHEEKHFIMYLKDVNCTMSQEWQTLKFWDWDLIIGHQIISWQMKGSERNNTDHKNTITECVFSEQDFAIQCHKIRV